MAPAGNAQLRRLQAGVGAFVALFLLLLYMQRSGSNTRENLHGLSRFVGWLYFVAWSVSFYPQLLLNLRRRSTEGLSYNFVWLNLLGFACYSVFNVAFYASPSVRESFRRAHHGDDNLVRVNDVFFAIHATVVSAATLVQMYCCGFRRSPGPQVWLSVRAFGMGAVGAAGVYLVAVIVHGKPEWRAGENNTLTMLSWLYFVSYIKLAVTLLKYTPQVYLNYSRKSTEGWSLHNVVLDFCGGLLSFVQLFIDASLEDDWHSIYGDPVKLGLSLLSLVFDLVFLFQHYVLYGASPASARAEPPAGQVPSRAAYEPVISHASDE